MKQPNHNEAGMLAFAIASATLDALVTKGLLTDRDELGVILAAADRFKGDPRANARVCEDFLRDAAKAHPASK